MYEELVIALRNNADHYMTVEGEAGLVHLLTDAADAIEELQARVKENDDWWAMAKTLVDMVAPKWIPVSERLPMDVGYYIVYCWDGHINRVSFAKWQKNNRRWDLSATRAYWKVSHWMPLPEPPKEET